MAEERLLASAKHLGFLVATLRPGMRLLTYAEKVKRDKDWRPTDGQVRRATVDFAAR